MNVYAPLPICPGIRIALPLGTRDRAKPLYGNANNKGSANGIAFKKNRALAIDQHRRAALQTATPARKARGTHSNPLNAASART